MNINQVWPEWHEDCVLGEGSFGKVFRAKRVEYGRTFYSAIKVLTVPKNVQEIKFARSQGMDDNEIYNYFRGLVDNLLNEITLMDNLKGAKNIVGIEDYKIVEHEGEIGWDIFIRMELLTSFDSFVSKPEFSQKDVIRLGVDICSALEVCEQNCIVHRDIKPDNIFISRFGEYKLGDFGIARKLEATQANLSRKGTLNYMAPEIYKGEKYGSNVDVYSLGLVLYTLLNNNRIAFLPPYPQPISYHDNEEALTKRLSGTPLTPPCNAGKSLGETVLKACAYFPQQRYGTATEFKNALIAEWNVLVQSGEEQEIQSDAMRFGGNMQQNLAATTNDMTANGRLVVEEYAGGTAVLEQAEENTAAVEAGAAKPGFVQNSAILEGNLPSKANKGCRILAWPLALALCALSFVLYFKNNAVFIEQTAAVSMFGIGFTVLLADRNKKAVGLTAVALSLTYIAEGLTVLLGGLREEFPVASFIILSAGLLLLFGGIVIFTQKEVRFGGSLCLYAVAIEWLFHIYRLLNQNFSVNLRHLFFGIAAVTVCVWSYGYKATENVVAKRRILHAVAYVFAALAFLLATVFATIAISAIFK